MGHPSPCEATLRPAPPHRSLADEPVPRMRDLRQRLIPPLWAGAEGTADGRLMAHPRERLDWRDMCRPVRDRTK